MKRLTAILIACLFLISCGAPAEPTPISSPEVAPTTVPPTKAPEPTSPPAPTATPEPTLAPTAKPEAAGEFLGDVVEGHGALLSAIAVEDPTEPGVLYSAEAGMKLVAVQVIVGNTSGDTVSVNPLRATLLDSEGYTYRPELGGRDGQVDTLRLSMGEKVRGWIAFEIPEGASPSGLKYDVEMFGDRTLKVGLAQPPEGHVPDTEALSRLPSIPSSGLGDTVEQYGYSFSAQSLEDPTTPGMLYREKPGTKLIAVEIDLGNVSGEPLDVNPLYAILADSHGYVYQAELTGRDEQIDVIELSPGEKARGWVAFSIPEDESPASVKYIIDVFGDEFLHTGLSR